MVWSSPEILMERGAVYSLLASLYLDMPSLQFADHLAKKIIPFPKILDEIQDHPDLQKGLDLIAEWMDHGPEDPEEIHSILKQEFTLLFVGSYRKPAPPYESVYRDRLALGKKVYSGLMMGESVDLVRSMYAKTGIHKSEDWRHHPDDHLGIELAFMGHLCQSAFEKAGEESVETRLLFEMQKTFLTEHLLHWVPRFSDDLFRCDEADFYKGIAKVTSGFVMTDSALLRTG